MNSKGDKPVQPFWKLLPRDPTPEDEICSCPDGVALKLMSTLSANPIHCMNCHRERPLNKVNLTEQQFGRIYNWHEVYGSIVRLELDSGAYEGWARRELEDLSSSTNQTALELLPELNRAHRFYFYIYQPAHDDNWAPPVRCPNCGGPLAHSGNGERADLICNACQIAMQGE